MKPRPIATAPLETRILMFGPCNGDAVMEDTKPLWAVGKWNGRVGFLHPVDYYSVRIEATHWLPLPGDPLEEVK